MKKSGIIIISACLFIGATIWLTGVDRQGSMNRNMHEQKGKNMKKEDLKKKLTPMQYNVTQECGTEPAFKNEYWNEKRQGIYVDVVSGEPLFISSDKFDSGTGWPSFTRPMEENKLVIKKDSAYGMVRQEVRSKNSDSHLGHVFEDGPAPGGLRYCINSAALRFVPVEELEKQGYGEYVKYFKNPDGKSVYETAIFAAGCFWGVEAIFAGLKGVTGTEAGYTGGDTKNPSYRDVSTGRTGHAEAVRVTYDPKIISYEELLDVFWRLHNPTTPDRQGPNVGTQYRSAIFYRDDSQKKKALESRSAFDSSKVFSGKAVTQIEPAGVFYRAEEYHQKYYEKHGGPVCHTLREK